MKLYGIFLAALATAATLLSNQASAAVPYLYSSCSGSFNSVTSHITNGENAPVYVTGYFSVSLTYVDTSGSHRSSQETYSVNEILSPFATKSFSSSIFGDITSCSSSTSGLTVAYLRPATPSSLKVVDATEHTLSITWKSASDGQVATDFFKVDYAKTSNISPSCSGPNSINVGKMLAATLVNLDKGSRYFVGVCAYGTNGQVSQSVLKTATVADPSPEVTSLVARSEAPDHIAANWTSGGGSTFDFIYILVRGNAVPASCSGGSVTTKPELSLFGFSPNTTYGLRVCSRNINEVASSGVGLLIRTQDPAHILLPFQDNFKVDNKNGLNPSWQIRSGSFSIKKSIAKGEDKDISIATLSGLTTVNSTARITVDRTGGFTKDGAGLVARYSFANGKHSMYAARVHKVSGKTEIQILGYFGGPASLLGSAIVGKEDGELQFVVNGTSLKVYLNNELVVSATDSRLPSAGAIGVISFGKNEEFDTYRAQ